MQRSSFAVDMPATAHPQSDVLVVGGGPVGIRAAQELVRQGKTVTLLSGETSQPYNRVRLTPLLSGDVQFGEILLAETSDTPENFTLMLGRRVAEIDRVEKCVVTADGDRWPYHQLVLATGSYPFVPNFPGTDLSGVMTFRTAEDASALVARSFSARKVAVIGGGLLGLEAARGMRRRQCDVTVIEHEGRLMPRQLDEAGGLRLARRIEALGVTVRTGVAVSRVLGEFRVTGLALGDGTELDCDTVIICTGIRANIGIAKEAGLAHNLGIVVNARMQTSDPDIYAVGECAQHDGQLYGLVGPGYLQAEVAASVIAGQDSVFAPATPATKLKVIGADVFSAGPVEQLDVRPDIRSHIWQDGEDYRRIFLDRGRLVGALGVGDWPQVSRVQDAVQTGVTVYPWMLYRFRTTGDLWNATDLPLDAQPDGATLCNCTGVNFGQIRRAIGTGADSAEALGGCTGAGTVCGTCRPLLAEMIDATAPPEPLPLWKPVLVLSGIAMLAALVPLLLGSVPLPTSHDAESLRTWLWRDNIVKQWSGFILLGITLAAMLIGLRKRIRLMDRLGGFASWRLVHIGIGVAALVAFFAHTGFSLGSNLNLVLGASFVAVLGLGAIAGLATGGDHELRARGVGSSRTPPRSLPTWLHILAIWPLPVLILLHVLGSYAF
ncbi:MAG: FAD-dependent oxidoreductase [Pseudomonadota bacterium]